MAAAAVFKPCSAYVCGALITRRRIICCDYQGQGRSTIASSFRGLRHRRVITRQQYVRALRKRDGGKEKCNQEGGVEDENAPDPRTGVPESVFLRSPDRQGLAKEEEQQQKQASEGEMDPPESCPGRNDKIIGFQKNDATTGDKEIGKQQGQQGFGKPPTNSTQPDARCRLTTLLRTVCRPQNLLAALLTGLVLYAIAFLGWQVMVVAVDVTLFLLKCTCVAVVLLLMYIVLI